MLQSMRSFTSSWLFKALFVLLIASFAVWGIGDVFRGGGAGAAVAEVGDAEISRGQLDEEFRRQVERLRPLFGGELTTERAVQMGLVDQALQSIIQRTLFDLAAADAGVRVGDEVVRRRITEEPASPRVFRRNGHPEPAFRDQFGQFDPALFRAVLRRSGISEADYVNIIRAEVARELVARSVAVGAVASDGIVADLHRFRGETRVAETITIPESAVGDVPAPDEAAIQAFYEDHPVRFTAPEHRALTAAILTPDDVAKDIAVSEEELRLAYEERAHEFRAPERRSIRMAVASGREQAAAIAAAAKEQGLDAAAQAAGLDAVTLEGVTRAELAELGDAAFALGKGTVSEPVQTPLGWHVLTVTDVTPAAERPFAQVREQLQADARRELAVDLVFEATNRIDDLLAGGATLEEVAQKEGLTIVTVPAVDATGASPEGKPALNRPEAQSIVRTGFQLAPDQVSQLVETPTGAVLAVRVDRVTPPALRPLDAVRDAVVEALKAERRKELLKAKVEATAERLRTGPMEPQALAREVGGSYALTVPFARDAHSVQGLPPALVEQLFAAAQPGTVVTGPADGAQVAARLKEVIPADPAAEAAIARVRGAVVRGVENDLVAQFTDAMRQRHPVRIHADRIAQMYAPN